MLFVFPNPWGAANYYQKPENTPKPSFPRPGYWVKKSYCIWENVMYSVTGQKSISWSGACIIPFINAKAKVIRQKHIDYHVRIMHWYFLSGSYRFIFFLVFISKRNLTCILVDTSCFCVWVRCGNLFWFIALVLNFQAKIQLLENKKKPFNK